MKTRDLWEATYPDFALSEEVPIRRLMADSRLVELPAEKTLFQPGAACGNYFLLIDGTIRVFVMTVSGREVLLYRVAQGEGCVITTACLLGGEPYNVFGITESPVRAFALSNRLFHESLNHSSTFRQFVFRGFAQRLSRILLRLEALVEGDIGQMLAEVLLSQHQRNTVTLTHQKLAEQIGTAREVVSRHLKHLEKRGWIQLSRGSIQLLDIAALEADAREGTHTRVR